MEGSRLSQLNNEYAHHTATPSCDGAVVACDYGATTILGADGYQRAFHAWCHTPLITAGMFIMKKFANA